jgi:FAD/FMN-containing dehydrogenase
MCCRAGSRISKRQSEFTARTPRRLLARAAGTSQCGQGVNVAVVIECSTYLHRRVSVDAQICGSRKSSCGVLCETLRDAAERHGLAFHLAGLLAK